MQHSAATIEEQLLLKSIREECPWENLPKRLRATFTSKEEWHKRIMDHCIKKRLQWNSCFARKVCKEGEYYEGMMHYLRKNLAVRNMTHLILKELFPYHLAEYICRVMRISPFRYYCDMIFEVMKNEQPYDSIPNFSAADALRLTGIGRNEFIDVMNKCRSKKIMWKLNKSIAKDFLPTQPVEFSIEPWWGVCLVNFTLEEFKKLTEEETATIDKICKEETNSFFLFDGNVIKGLHRRGLIYFDVPVYPEDCFKVSRLEGFVSNREQSYEDPIEELLYAVFVVSSENATVAELAATLQADLPQLQAAASFACRLGWAVKMIDPASILGDANIPGSPHNLSDEDDDSNASVSSINVPVGISPGTEVHRSGSGLPRVAFIVDANITSYLMMGSISPGLKSHAVTLYEAGKLGHASISDLCKDLTALEGKKFEGELQEFANHAFSLKSVLECLQSGGTDIHPGFRDKIDLHSLINDTDRPPQSNSSIYDVSHNMQSEIKAPESDDLFTGDDLEIPQIETCSSEHCTQNPSDEASLKGSPEQLSNLVHDIKINDNMFDGKDSVSSRGSLADCKNIKKTYLVNILRCESLASLAPATLDRLFLRDYDIIVSMAPLPSSSVLPGASGPVHFGPASYASMTPWMKLVLYTSVGNGPLSVVLMKGQCLRMLPAPLVGCEKALIWSWDGSVIGGLGGKFEGCLINGNILLHCINSMLKCSAVLVQPLYKCDLDESGKTMTIDVPLPLKNSDGSVANVGLDMGLHEEEISKLNTVLDEISLKIELWTVGYIRLLKLQKERESDDTAKNDQHEWVPLSLEFGIPLFNPDLTNKICARVVSSHILQTDSLDVHHNEMQSLRKRLRDICSEYQATGPTAKLFYHREQPKEPPRQLMNFASGKWNPFVEPTTLISGASNEHQRLKLANRHRFRQEVLSFDGNILRSYALVPVYEAATRTIEESASTISVKAESDDVDSREVVLPGVNLLFDGSQLHPFDITACLQARQPICLVADASAASAAIHAARVL